MRSAFSISYEANPSCCSNVSRKEKKHSWKSNDFILKKLYLWPTFCTLVDFQNSQIEYNLFNGWGLCNYLRITGLKLKKVSIETNKQK